MKYPRLRRGIIIIYERWITGRGDKKLAPEEKSIRLLIKLWVFFHGGQQGKSQHITAQGFAAAYLYHGYG